MKPIPVQEAKGIASRYEKDQVLIVAWDAESNLTHVVTYGRLPEHKVQAAKAGEWIARELGLDRARQQTYEDFRRVPAAERARKIETLRDSLREVVEQCSAAIRRDILELPDIDDPMRTLVRIRERAEAALKETEDKPCRT
jgi:hypothetical protein